MLAVVQDQQQALVADEAGQPVGLRWGLRLAGILAQPQGRGHDLGQEGRVAEAGQLDQPHPVGIAADQPPGQLHGNGGLARPARPDHSHQPVQLHQLGDLAKLLVPPDQAGQAFGQVVAGLAAVSGRQLQGRVLDQDGLVEALQLRRRVDPQLLGQHLAGLPVHAQGVGLAA